jgi:hypothetical protein
MNENDIQNNTYGISNFLKIIILVMSIFSIPIIIYLSVRYVFEIDTFGDQKYLIIILIIYFFIIIYCISILKHKIIYYDKIIIYKYLFSNKTIELNKYKYFKIDYNNIPISYLLFTDDKSKKERIHFYYTKQELFYNYLLNNLEEIK